jgi:hypothetical protein
MNTVRSAGAEMFLCGALPNPARNEMGKGTGLRQILLFDYQKFSICSKNLTGLAQI